jgi:hypothetical protein
MTNPLSGLLNKQLGGGSNSGDETNPTMPSGGVEMVKSLASSFLSSSSTVMEYDLSQARNMQGGVLFNMAFMWFLHFKMEQIQPLLIQAATGLMNLMYSPLFQVYVMGRNLERPFKQPANSNPFLRIPEPTTPPTTGEADETTDTDTATVAAADAADRTDIASSNTEVKDGDEERDDEEDTDDEVSKIIEEIVGEDDAGNDETSEQ